MKETIKISAEESLGLYEWKQLKPWPGDKCSQYLDQRKQATTQWAQDSNWSNADDLNNVRHEDSRHFRNKKKEYLKAKIVELETSGKRKNVRDLCGGISDFYLVYQPRSNIVKDEKDDLVTNSLSILARWRNHFSQLLKVLGANDIRRLHYTQQSHWCLSWVPLMLWWLSAS
jgi:hypothetical protein